jgi:hypothetical protein
MSHTLWAGRPVEAAGEHQAMQATPGSHRRVEGRMPIGVLFHPIEERCADGGSERVSAFVHANVQLAERGEDLLTAHELDPGAPATGMIGAQERDHRLGHHLPMRSNPTHPRLLRTG